MDTFTLDKVEFDALRRIVAGFCRCSLGKALAMRIGPSRNPEIVQRWLTQTSQMVQAVRDISLPPLGGVTNITEALKRAHPSAGAAGEDFAAIAATLEAAGNVREYLFKLPESLGELRHLAGGIGTFDDELQAIRAVVGPDGSILDNASDKLMALRREIAGISRQIHDVIYGYVKQPDVARLLQNPTVTLHDDRYVLPVKTENRGRLPGVVHRASHSGATVFVEPNACVELNNRLTDLQDDHRREVQRLLNDLAMRVQERVADISGTLHQLAQVDLLAAKAQYAYQFEMTCPEVSDHGTIQLHQVRHPLLVDQAYQQERAGMPADKRHAVVPIDVRLGQDFDLLIITGSNTGGKTVTLKTVALVALMAQSGMFIPARRGAKLPVFRDLFMDVGDEQSLEQSLSTFGAHIERIRYILRKADKSSLVLMDELGAGTDPEEGGAIGQAILDELRRIGCLGMVTTHLSVLKAYAYANERVDNASVEFDTATLSPTYHLHIGTPGESHAITVSEKLGLAKRLTHAARRYLAAQGKQFRKAIRATGAARQAAEQARAEAHNARLAAEDQQETYQAKLSDLNRLQEEFATWLARLPELKPGDEVHAPSLGGKAGRLVRLELHRQIALVDADNVQVEVPIEELVPNLGQDKAREQMALLRKQMQDQTSQAQKDQQEAERIRKEYHRSLTLQKERARQFDNWLSAIARIKVGDEVSIARKPGKGKLLRVDLPGLRATVQTNNGEMELSLQDLFPQTGPFAAREPKPSRQRRTRHKQAQRPGQKAQPKRPPDRPMHRGAAEGKKADKKNKVLLDAHEGQQVFVVPFHKRATLIRIDRDKSQAVVQSGAFEMQLPLSDLEPIESPK